jgi:Rieske Fe-S protein
LRRRVARLDELPVGEPRLLLVKGTRQDGWTRHAEQVVGRVWVTRTSPAATPPGQVKVAVFNAACPHSGCVIAQAEQKGFACHCHGAMFRPDGEKVKRKGYVNPSPRGMDPLGHVVVKDEASGQWWVEVEYKAFETGLEKRVEKG